MLGKTAIGLAPDLRGDDMRRAWRLVHQIAAMQAGYDPDVVGKQTTRQKRVAPAHAIADSTHAGIDVAQTCKQGARVVHGHVVGQAPHGAAHLFLLIWCQ